MRTLAESKFRLSLLLSLALALSIACGGAAPLDDADLESSSDDVSDVPQTVVKRQSIGNCWVYATCSWLESMHKTATGQDLNASESYITYWHWFEQITGGEVGSNKEISTGGGWEVASYLITRYGVVTEKDFIGSEAEVEMSNRQKSALAAINESLKTGALKTATARRSKGTVRKELDKAWALDTGVVTALDKVFGKTVTKNLTTKSASTGKESANTAGTFIKRAREIAASFTEGPGKPLVKKTLVEAMKTWREVSYWSAGSSTTGRRNFQKRIQRALHDSQPVILSWFVDFNALDSEGRFAAPPATPGHQGGHMVVMEDYEVTDVPGYGTLKAGVKETRPEALAAALSDSAKISFIRVKNSWGSYRSDRNFVLPGYHDLYTKYLNGPVKQCEENADGSPNTADCWDTVPLQDVVLPPGY